MDAGEESNYDDETDADSGTAWAFWGARTIVSDRGGAVRRDDLLLARQQVGKQVVQAGVVWG